MPSPGCGTVSRLVPGIGSRTANETGCVSKTTGRERLQAASAAARSVETQMGRGLTITQQQQLRDLLASCVRSLSES